MPTDPKSASSAFLSSPLILKEVRLARGEESAEDADVEGRLGALGTVGAHLFDRQPGLAASVDVDLVCTTGQLALPQVSGNPEGNDDGGSEVRNWLLAKCVTSAI